MDHFPGITPQERYNNDLLNEIRLQNSLLQQLLERNAQAVEQPKITRRRKAANQ